MSFETHVVVASRRDAEAVADTDCPTVGREGFTFSGFDRVQACTLLSILSVGDPETEFERYLDSVEVVQSSTDDWPVVSILNSIAVSEFAKIVSMDETEFDALADAWRMTDEFEGWTPTDIHVLLHELGDLAATAVVQNKCMMIWQSP